MKKLLALTLAFMLVFALAACGGSEGTESSGASSKTESSASVSKAESSAASSDEASSEGTSSVTESSEAVSEDTSSAAESSETTSSEDTSSDDTSSTPDNPSEPPEFLNNFLSIGVVDTKVNATSTNAIRLTGVDVEPTYGSIVLYTAEYGLLDAEELADFAVAVFTYDHEFFGYVKTAFYEVGEAEEIEAPEDGFLVAAHSYQADYIARLKDIAEDVTIFPHGLRLFDGLDYDVLEAETAPSIDGVFNEDEWDDYLIDSVDQDNDAWSYAQFEKDNYYATAKYYVAYDAEYLYLCVVVTSPYHHCPVAQANANDMWQYECIQVKVSSESPDGEYILTNFDHVANNAAVSSGTVRSYGFAVNNDGDTCYYESGFSTTFTGLAGCSRDDSAQQTVYEVAIPFAEFGITPESGMQLGLTFSINSTNEEDIAAGVWKNITYRCGGGVIGRNDWSKIPVITLD